MSIRRYRATVGDRTLEVELGSDSDRSHVLLNGEPLTAELSSADGQGVRRMRIGDRVHEVLLHVSDTRCHVAIGGVTVEVLVEDERAARLASFGGGKGSGGGLELIAAPMPGLVVSVNVETGQEVNAGQSLVVLQAMKMENELSSPRDGTVKAVHAQAGQPVEQGQALVELEAGEAG
jgi:biotin carboxyl carrier protein